MKIEVKKRKISGRKVKSIREEGMIPASVYGPKRESINVQVGQKEFSEVFKEAGHSKMFDLGIEGEKTPGKALIREVQNDPVTGDIIHVSFYELDLKKPITTEVPVVTKGTSKAVKDNIGFLVIPYESLEVRCLPEKLPPEIVVNIGNLNEIGDSLAVSDLDLPEGVELTANIIDSATVAYIAPPQKEIVEEEPEVAAEEAEEGEGEEGEGEEGEEAAEGEEGEGAERTADEGEAAAEE